jgi:hypothetical protein
MAAAALADVGRQVLIGGTSSSHRASLSPRCRRAHARRGGRRDFRRGSAIPPRRRRSCLGAMPRTSMTSMAWSASAVSVASMTSSNGGAPGPFRHDSSASLVVTSSRRGARARPRARCRPSHRTPGRGAGASRAALSLEGRSRGRAGQRSRGPLSSWPAAYPPAGSLPARPAPVGPVRVAQAQVRGGAERAIVRYQ